MVGVPLLIDTSVALNLLATEVSLAVLESLELDCFVCSAVIAETIYLRSDDPRQAREVVLIDPWLQSASVKVITIGSALEEEL